MRVLLGLCQAQLAVARLRKNLGENIGQFSSIAIGNDGYPVIAHTTSTSYALFVTKCSSLDCSSISATTEIRYDNEEVGWYTSIAIGTDGNPVIAYRNKGSSPDTLLITKCASPDCTSISTTTEVFYGNDDVA